MTTTTTTAAYIPEAITDWSIDHVPAHHRDAMRALIPSEAAAPSTDGYSGYITRMIDGVRDMDAFGIAMDAGYHVLLTGPTGSAKTSAGRAFAALHGLPFYSIAVNGGIDPAAIWGRWNMEGTEGDEGAPARLNWEWTPAGMIAQWGGVLVFDEVNMAHPRIAAAFHELLDIRRTLTIPEYNGAVVNVSDAVFIVATMNPGYAGTVELNAALARRFAWRIEWPYSDEVESVLIPSETLRAFARDVRESADVRTDLSTDALVVFCDTAAAVSPEFAAARLVDAFKPSEREGVRRALELKLPTIAAELAEGIE